MTAFYERNMTKKYWNYTMSWKAVNDSIIVTVIWPQIVITHDFNNRTLLVNVTNPPFEGNLTKSIYTNAFNNLTKLYAKNFTEGYNMTHSFNKSLLRVNFTWPLPPKKEVTF
jgi:hypothetical protein